jgi:2-amino-4-hydroxy-6-hydroxymethyldihydropteridine diphosphokinase
VLESAFIGLGGNLGDPVAAIRQAILVLDAEPAIDVASVSHVYESEPWGPEDQPPFANAVAQVRTTLRADQLLGVLTDVETRLGRRRTGRRNGPRRIDLDLLLFGDEEWDTETLTLPHPRMAERDFVLTPLLAIAPDARWPDGSPISAQGGLVGRVIADHGRVPGLDPDWYVWEAMHAEAAPVPPGGGSPDESPWAEAPWDPTAGAWVEVARGRAAGGEIDILESKLRAAGIPYELSHRELGDAIGSLAGPARVLVPSDRADEARSLLARTPLPGGGLALSRDARGDYEPPPLRPTWFRATLRVFGWMFAIYWIVRILVRGGLG